MAVRARLAVQQPDRQEWKWHAVPSVSLPVSTLFGGDRRMEAEAYLLGGYGLRTAIEARPDGWIAFEQLAKVWQPSRLKGIQVSSEYGTPFLAATQVFDVRPTPRKWLALERTEQADQRFVDAGTLLVTCSGAVGRATLAYAPHLNILISHDLLRVHPLESKYAGWLYAYLRAPTTYAMMTSAQYGHVVKHLETSHLNALPIPKLPDSLLASFSERTRAILDRRNDAYAATKAAEDRFTTVIGMATGTVSPTGFAVNSSDLFESRRRLESSFHAPAAQAILAHFSASGLTTEPLSGVTDGVWWLTRFARVFGDEGAPYMSADDLFSINPTVDKRVIVEQADNADQYFLKNGWIAMVCSGQAYGLLGSVALMTSGQEHIFFSHDLIRIRPRTELIRPGYLFTVLGHPALGRPLVIRYAYGTSIPHLEPKDVATFPVVRLSSDDENYIADNAEQAARWRAEADQLENALANDAERILTRFIAGEPLEEHAIQLPLLPPHESLQILPKP